MGGHYPHLDQALLCNVQTLALVDGGLMSGDENPLPSEGWSTMMPCHNSSAGNISCVSTKLANNPHDPPKEGKVGVHKLLPISRGHSVFINNNVCS